MAKEKQLIKVVGTTVSGIEGGRPATTVARGIVQLKRGVKLHEFIHDFLQERGIVQYTLHQRGDSWAMEPTLLMLGNPKLVLTYVFTQFPLSEIGYYGKDLTRPELLRDFKFLRRILEKQ